MKNKFNRRKFVSTSLSSTLLHPIFRAMEASAANEAPKRFVGWFTPQGKQLDKFWPKNIRSETDFDLPILLKAYEPILSDMILIRNTNPKLKNGNGGHVAGANETLTGVRGQGGSNNGYSEGTSVDRFLAEKLNKELAYIGVNPNSNVNNLSSVSRRGKNGIYFPYVDPVATWNQFLQSAVSGKETNNKDAMKMRQELERKIGLETSILDKIQADYKKLYKFAGQAEKEALDEHLDSLRDMESALQKEASVLSGESQSITTNSCSKIIKPAAGLNKGKNFVKLGELQMQMMLKTLQCGVADIGLFQWLVCSGGAKYSIFGDSHHYLTHQTDNKSKEKLTKIHIWYAERLVEFVNALKTTIDIDGRPMLDNTMIFCFSDLANGQNNDHSRKNLPFRFVGGRSFGLKGGRILDAKGADHLPLLTSICQLMGVDVKGYGARPDCGPFAGLV